jgi:hypothetical protein
MSNLIFWQEATAGPMWKSSSGNHSKSPAPRLAGNAEVVDCTGGHALVIHIVLSLVRNVAPMPNPAPDTVNSPVEDDRKVQQCDS